MSDDIWEILARVVSGQSSEHDRRTIETWCALSTENETALRDAERLWAITESTHRPSLHAPDPGSLQGQANRRTSAKRRKAQRLVATAAAIAALAIGFQSWSARTPESAAPVQTLTLPDGSLVRLAPEAKVTFVESESQRVVTLQGRAFFAVHHDAQRPFLVTSGSREIQVLGTRFQAVAGDHALSTTVLDGRVSLTSSDSTVLVEPGYASTAGNQTPPSAPIQVGRGTLTQNWSNLLLFGDTRLEDALAEVELHFGIRVTISPPDAAYLPVTGDFPDQSAEQVVGTLCATVGATCRILTSGAGELP